jgi:lipid-A-disaccharide synthase
VAGNKQKIMIIAGEASGDLHGAHLVRAMRALNPDLDFFGIGGNALRQVGVHLMVDNSQIAVVGISEAFLKFKIILSALRVAKEGLRRIRPALLIVIDFPDFNLHVATAAKKLSIPVMYYISPQVWAWRTGRVKKIKNVVDHMVVIFPFEVDFYKKSNVPVTFVGHPLLDSMTSGTSREKKKNLKGDSLIIGLLPGSRNGEVARLLPTMVQVADILSEQLPSVRFAIPVASSVDRTMVEAIVEGGTAARPLILHDGLRDVLDDAALVITASGTVTLEAAIAGTPMIIVYKVSPLSYWLGKRLIRVKHIGMANLVAGRPIVPELIQHEASAEKIARRALHMLRDEKGLAEIRRQLHHVAQSLGTSGASKRAAEVAMNLVSGSCAA